MFVSRAVCLLLCVYHVTSQAPDCPRPDVFTNTSIDKISGEWIAIIAYGSNSLLPYEVPMCLGLNMVPLSEDRQMELNHHVIYLDGHMVQGTQIVTLNTTTTENGFIVSSTFDIWNYLSIMFLSQRYGEDYLISVLCAEEKRTNNLIEEVHVFARRSTQTLYPDFPQEILKLNILAKPGNNFFVFNEKCFDEDQDYYWNL